MNTQMNTKLNTFKENELTKLMAVLGLATVFYMTVSLFGMIFNSNGIENKVQSNFETSGVISLLNNVQYQAKSNIA